MRSARSPGSPRFERHWLGGKQTLLATRWPAARRGRPSARHSERAGKRRGNDSGPVSPRRSMPTGANSKSNEPGRPSDVGGHMSNADDIDRRAQEIIAKAQRISEDASDAGALRDELDRLDAELAQLDEEQRRLDEDMVDRGDSQSGDSTRTSDGAPWTETIADIVADVTERLGAIGGG